jgi:hypothetical protein
VHRGLARLKMAPGAEPFVFTSNWTVIDYLADDGGFASLMNEEGETREDLKLDPLNTHARHEEIINTFKSAGEVNVRVFKAMGTEMIFPMTG